VPTYADDLAGWPAPFHLLPQVLHVDADSPVEGHLFTAPAALTRAVTSLGETDPEMKVSSQCPRSYVYPSNSSPCPQTAAASYEDPITDVHEVLEPFSIVLPHLLWDLLHD